MLRVASRNCIEKLIKINFRRGQTVRKITPDRMTRSMTLESARNCNARRRTPGRSHVQSTRRNAAFALQAHMPHSDRPYWRSQQLAIYAVLIVLVIGFTRRFRIDHQGADQISGES